MQGVIVAISKTIVHPRSDWTTASAPSGPVLTASGVAYIAVHYPGSSGTLAGSDTASKLRGWRTYHVSGRGWRDIAYNEAVDQRGEAWVLRGHVADGSVKNMGGEVYSILAAIGNDEPMTPAMQRTLRERVKAAQARYPRAKVVGHKDLVSTSCPGKIVHAWLKAGMPVTGTAEPKPPASSSKIPAGAIVMVAGAGNTMLDKLSGKYRRRLDVALELVKGTSTKILVTGGRKTGRPTPEATRAAEYLTGKGIPASRILTETSSGSTNGNFSLGMPIAAKAGAKSVVVVSDQSHMRRCLSMAYASAKKHSLDLPISGAHWYPDSTTQDATVLQATQQARDIWAGMTEQIVRDLDVKWGITKAPVAPGVAPKFPLPAGYYFGPKEPTSNARAVSGYFGRKFSGETDRTWLKLWQTQAKKAGIYTGQIDGLYGPATATAARAVQQRKKLTVDGLIGADTWPAVWQI